jgi:hypothetical protein
MDHQWNAKVSLLGRYTFDGESVNSATGNPNFANNNSKAVFNPSRNTVLSPKTVNHSHVACNRTFQRNDNRVTVPIGPEYSFR